MKFLADMGISPRTVNYLRTKGYDAIHLAEQRLQTLEDSEILEKARQENRIVLTVDLDFGYLLAISGGLLPSVILFRLGNESYEMINDRLDEILVKYEEYLKTGAIISVRDDSDKVRKLPI